MPRRFATGLVVGKFAPLHRGHEALIRHAQQLCDHVVIISWTNPEYPECGPERRAQWLEELFPDTTRLVLTRQTSGDLPVNTAPDDVHRNLVADECIHRLKRRVDAVFTSERYGPGFAEVLTQRFMSAGMGSTAVTHVSVDPDRIRIPMSGSQLRADPWLHWTFLPPAVARTLVHRIAILGGESTGKSTLAQAMAREFRTEWAQEYGRELWEARQGALTFEDMAAIADEQIRREDRATENARRYLFCDSTPLTTLFYSQHLFGKTAPELGEAACRTYNLTVLCEPDFRFVQDGTRQGPEFTAEQQTWYRMQLIERGIPFLSVRGTLKERIEVVCDHLQQKHGDDRSAGS